MTLLHAGCVSLHARDHFQLVGLIRALIARGHVRVRPPVPRHQLARLRARLAVSCGGVVAEGMPSARLAVWDLDVVARLGSH